MINLPKYTMDKSDPADCRIYTERRDISKYQEAFKRYYLCCIFFGVSCLISSTVAQSTSCDFSGSGLDLDGTGVQPVYLSCAAGRVEWQFPRAALRIILRYPHAKGEFHGCIKSTPAIEGARLFVEGHRSLVPLYSKDDGRPKDMVRCFTSYKGQAALYLEAEPSSGFKKQTASFEYDLQLLSKGELYDPWEECRPCTDSELVQLYCSADFVAKGFIINAHDDVRLQRTIITLVASRVFQQTTPVFSARDRAAAGEDGYHSNFISDNDRKSDRQFTGQLFASLQCGVRAGPGEFMFLGSLRLGEPILRCAPRIEDWRQLIKTANQQAHCVLEK